MQYKLFFTTFLLIFLAELGDKTQLTAMARAATGDGSRWIVFVAASAALVTSTLIAVLFGSTLTRLVPLKFIKIGAGVLFLVFGALTLYSAFAPPAAKRATGKDGKTATTSPALLRLAAVFEEAAAEDYRQLAERASDPGVRDLLDALAAEERSHLERIRGLDPDPASDQPEQTLPEGLPEHHELMHDVADDSQDVLSHAIEHETATQQFYEELARIVHVPRLAASFTRLAEEEAEHVRRLKEMAGKLES